MTIKAIERESIKASSLQSSTVIFIRNTTVSHTNGRSDHHLANWNIFQSTLHDQLQLTRINRSRSFIRLVGQIGSWFDSMPRSAFHFLLRMIETGLERHQKPPRWFHLLRTDCYAIKSSISISLLSATFQVVTENSVIEVDFSKLQWNVPLLWSIIKLSSHSGISLCHSFSNGDKLNN